MLRSNTIGTLLEKMRENKSRSSFIGVRAARLSSSKLSNVPRELHNLYFSLSRSALY